MSLLNLLRFISIRHLFQKRLRSALTILGIGLGIALFLSISLINRATIRSFRESMEAISGSAKLVIRGGESGFPEEILAKIEKLPGVKRAIPMIIDRAYLVGKQSSETLVILGVDLLKEQAVRSYEMTDGKTVQMMDDPLIFLNQPDSIMVSAPFARSHHLVLDSHLELATAHGKKKFTVRGILAPSGPAKAFGGAVAIMDIDGARVSFGKEGRLDRVDLVTDDKDNEQAHLDDLKRLYQEALGPSYSIRKPEGQADDLVRMVSAFQNVLIFMSSLAVLVGLFMVTNSVSVSVAERRREIGTLRALGVTRGGILGFFLTEAALLGIIGSCLGAGLGWILSQFLLEIASETVSSQILTRVNIPHVWFEPIDFIVALMIGSVASTMAAFWPAYKATCIQPIEAIRNKNPYMISTKAPVSMRLFFGGAICLITFTLFSMMRANFNFPRLDFVNQMLCIIGTLMVTPLLANYLALFLRKFVSRFGGVSNRLAHENILRDPHRTASNVLALLISLVMVLIVSTVNHSFRMSIRGWLNKILQADLLISSQGQIGAFQTQPLQEDLGISISKLPEVAPLLAAPIRGMRFIHFDYEGRTVGLKAYDSPAPIPGYSVFDMMDGDANKAGKELFNGVTPTVFVSANFSRHFSKKKGDSLTLNSPSGPFDAKIVGLISDYASSEGVIYIDRRLFKKYWHDSLVNIFHVNLLQGAVPEQVRRAIDSSFGQANNLMVYLNSELKDDVAKSVDKGFAYGRAIDFAALIIGLLGMMNVFLISVMERTREIGLLRAVGMSRGQTFSMILFEALSQGLIATLLAIVLGTAIAFIWITFSLEFVLGWSVQFYMPFNMLFVSVALGLIVSCIAGILPSHRASHLDIKEALAYE